VKSSQSAGQLGRASRQARYRVGGVPPARASSRNLPRRVLTRANSSSPHRVAPRDPAVTATQSRTRSRHCSGERLTRSTAIDCEALETSVFRSLQEYQIVNKSSEINRVLRSLSVSAPSCPHRAAPWVHRRQRHAFLRPRPVAWVIEPQGVALNEKIMPERAASGERLCNVNTSYDEKLY
jgi:hypothetical protein